MKVEAYLTTLSAKLRGLHRDEVRDIVQELRGHIVEKASVDGEVTSAGIDTALTSLGSPDELASEYVTDHLLARAEVTRSPLRILGSLFRWATLSVAGFFVFLGSIIGYLIGGSLMWAGVLKIIHPQTAGLWMWHDQAGEITISVRMGFEGPPPGAKDLLGWWLLPIGLAVGCMLVIFTTRAALWCVRRYRSSRVLARR